MVLSIKAAANAAYYYQANGLEQLGDYAKGRWHGVSTRLGVQSGEEVDPKILDLLLRRRSKGGLPPTFNRSDASSGRDFVFSAPKSVSIFWAFAPTAIKRVIEVAQIEAVTAAVELLLREVCRERCGKGGVILKPAKGVVALFNHVATRTALHKGDRAKEALTFPDPNLHTHVVMPDIVASEDDRLKIGYTALHRHWSMALGAWYHASLAFNLRQQGFEIRATGNNGLFQLENRKDAATGWRPWSDWIAAFSARTMGLTGAMGQRRALLESPSAEDETTLTKPSSRDIAKAFEKTRASVVRIDPEELSARWNTHAAALGDINLSLVISCNKIKSDNNLSAERRATLFAAVVEDAGATDAVLQSQDLCRALASRIVADGMHLQPDWELVKTLQADATLLTPIEASRSYGFAQWTAKANSILESKVLKCVEELSRSRLSQIAISPQTKGELSALNEDQQRLAATALSSARLTVINGAPGTGKTRLLGPVIRAFKRQGDMYNVVGAAEAWQPALALKRDFDIPAFSLAHLFHDGRRQNVASDGATAKSARPRNMPIGPKSLLIVDEAGLLGTKRMHAVLDLALKRGAKLILVGDDGQLNPIGAGSGMRLVQGATPTPTEPLKVLMRQGTSDYRVIAEGFVALRHTPNANSRMFGGGDGAPQQTAGRIASAMIKAHCWNSYGASNPAVDRIVDVLMTTKPKTNDTISSIIALARSNREVHHITRRLRVRLRAQNVLQGPDIVVRGVSPMGVTMRLDIAKGERIRFLVRNQQLDVYNGTCATVEEIDAERGCERLTVSIDGPRGSRRVSFPISLFHDDKGRARIAPAYAGTVYGCQGISVDEVVVLKSAAMTFRELYVAATRARARCEIVEVNATRAFLLTLEDTPQLQAKRVQSIARELMGSARRDRPKPNAEDYSLNRRRNLHSDRSPWLWSAMFEENSAESDEPSWRCAEFQPLNNGRETPPRRRKKASRSGTDRGAGTEAR